MTRLPLTILLLGAGLAACGGPESPDHPYSKTPGERVADDATRMRRDFRDAVQRRLDQLDVKLDELRAKARDADEATRAKLDKLADDLKQKKSEAADDLRKLSDDVSDQWDVLKRKIENSLDDLERRVKDALS